MPENKIKDQLKKIIQTQQQVKTTSKAVGAILAAEKAAELADK